MALYTKFVPNGKNIGLELWFRFQKEETSVPPIFIIQ